MVKFQKGQIVFFNYDISPYHKLIQFYNFIEYRRKFPVHVGVIFQVNKDDVIIAEALGRGFTISAYGKQALKDWHKEGLIEIGRANKKLENIQPILAEYEGKPYGFLDIVGITISFLTGYRFKRITGASHMICSESTARFLYDASNKQINISEEFNKPYDLIDPVNVYMSEYIDLIYDIS